MQSNLSVSLSSIHTHTHTHRQLAQKAKNTQNAAAISVLLKLVSCWVSVSTKILARGRIQYRFRHFPPVQITVQSSHVLHCKCSVSTGTVHHFCVFSIRHGAAAWLANAAALCTISIRLSHTGTVTKRIKLRSQGLHYWIASSPSSTNHPSFRRGKVHLEIQTESPQRGYQIRVR